MCDACEPFEEPPVVAHQTKESVHLCVGLWQGTFCNCFQVAGVNPIFWNLMC